MAFPARLRVGRLPAGGDPAAPVNVPASGRRDDLVAGRACL
jgi:hypothetical protein